MDSYERLSAENSSYGDLKNIVEDEQVVKNAQLAYNAALEKWVQDGHSADTFETDPDSRGATLSNELKEAKRTAYRNLMDPGADGDKAFQAKVAMHNRRFGTGYNEGTNWDVINKKRKAVKAEFEATQARKPKK